MYKVNTWNFLSRRIRAIGAARMVSCLRGCAVAVAWVVVFFHGTIHAEASGPDYFRTRPLETGSIAELRKSPHSDSVVLSRLPENATCLKNLGCQGGLSLEGFATLSKESQRARLLENPRWCQVEYRGSIGWINSSFLEEGACPGAPAEPMQQSVRVANDKGQISIKEGLRGDASKSYLLRAAAGQLLTVKLKAKHPQIYFNVTPAHGQEAMFVGSTSGNAMQRRVPADGDYRVDVYFMRAAARRGESGDFSLDMNLTGKALVPLPASKDALVAGTAFHATAVVGCRVPYKGEVKSCNAGSVRRGFDGSATVVLTWPGGQRNLLFVKGQLAASDSSRQPVTVRNGDVTKVRFGDDEFFDIPDPLLTGG